MANSIFPPLSLRPLPSAPMEALLEGDCLILRGTLREKGVKEVKALVQTLPARIELSSLHEIDGSGFALLVSLGLQGATWVAPSRSLRQLLAKTRLFEVIEVEYE